MQQHPHSFWPHLRSCNAIPGMNRDGPSLIETTQPAVADYVRIAERARLSDRTVFDAFPRQRFVNLGWSLLLELYVADRAGKKLDVSSLCRIGTVPISTALRRINSLCDAGYIARQQDEQDGRRSFLLLPQRTRQQIENCLDLLAATLSL